MDGGPCGYGGQRMPVNVLPLEPNCWWWETGSKLVSLEGTPQEYNTD